MKGMQPFDGKGPHSDYRDHTYGTYSNSTLESVYKLNELGYNVIEIETYNPYKELWDMLVTSEHRFNAILTKELNENT
ncbi:MAG: hypothetical protein ACRCWQ_02160 [Bacilli bacterium]